MPSQILPITIHQSSKPSSPPLDPTPIQTPLNTMLLKPDMVDDPTARLLDSSPFEDETIISINPLLSTSSSFAGTTATTTPTPTATTSTNYHQKTRRRISSDSSISSLSDDGSGSGQRHSLTRDVGHAAAETFLLTRLSLKLLRYLGYNSSFRCFLNITCCLFCRCSVRLCL